MKNSLKLLTFTLFAASFFGNVFAHASIYGDLDPESKALVDNGEQAIVTEDVEGSAWPNITVYQRIEATPDQLAAVMFDYPLHAKIFYNHEQDHGIYKAVPRSPGFAETDVDYAMSFPTVMGISLPDEIYSVHNQLKTLDQTGYEINWALIKASTMKDTFGSVKFEKLGTGTLIAYFSFIKPPRPALSRLIVNMAITRVQDTVTALAKQTFLERDSIPAKLNAQLAALNKALGR